jgi:hypothetical protein
MNRLNPRRLLLVTVLICAAAAPLSSARGEMLLYDKDGWTLKTDGLAQGFYMLSFGDVAPAGPNIVNFDFLGTGPAGSGNTFLQSRFRSGWTGGRFNWRATKQMSENVKASAYLGVAYSISTEDAPPATNNAWDIRNGYLELEGPFGDVVIGRSVGLYTLGGIISTINITSAAMGLGNTCGVGGNNLSCYTSGYGVKFPGFWAGFYYTTPSLGGLKIKVAALDPVTVGANSTITPNPLMPMMTTATSQLWSRKPLPHFQTLITYSKTVGSLTINPFFNGFWQQIGKAGSGDTLNPYGAGAGVDLFVGAFKVGVGGSYEKGTTLYVPLFGGEAIDGAGQLRDGAGFYAQARYTIGQVDVMAGYGQSGLNRSAFDVTNNLDINKVQRNIWGALQYHTDPITWVAELNSLHHEWYGGEKQAVEVISLGASFAY